MLRRHVIVMEGSGDGWKRTRDLGNQRRHSSCWRENECLVKRFKHSAHSGLWICLRVFRDFPQGQEFIRKALGDAGGKEIVLSREVMVERRLRQADCVCDR